MLGPTLSLGKPSENDNARREIMPLYRLFKVKNASVHYLLVIDTSLSMAPSFEQVKDALASLTESLEVGDSVSIIGFDNRPKLIYQGRVRQPIKKLSAKLPSGPSSNGKKTDIGAAVDLAVKQIAANPADLQLMFFLTDGKNEPPESSAYKQGSSAGWERLKKRVAKLKDKTVKVHGIGLNSNTDIDLLRQVFPDSSEITLAPAELKKYFIGLKENIKEERLKAKLKRELKEGNIIITSVKGKDWGNIESNGRLIKRYRLVSNYKHLPVIITLGRPRLASLTGKQSSDGFKMKIKGARSFELKPGEKRIVSVELSAPKLLTDYHPGRRKDIYRGRLDLGLKGKLKYGNALTELGMGKTAASLGGTREFNFTHQRGLAFSTVAALAAALLLFLGVITKVAIMPLGRAVAHSFLSPRLPGRLTFSAAPAGSELPLPVDLAALGRRAVIGSAGAIKLTGDEIAAEHAELFARWKGGQPTLYLRKLEGEVSVGSTTLGGGHKILDEIELKRGNIIEIGDYKMEWV